MNRRKSQRAKVDLLVNRFLDGHPYLCRVTDISPSGLRLVPILEPKGEHRFMGLQLRSRDRHHRDHVRGGYEWSRRPRRNGRSLHQSRPGIRVGDSRFSRG
jgi:hypothetical protein